jgi:hypothetical protein
MPAECQRQVQNPSAFISADDVRLASCFVNRILSPIENQEIENRCHDVANATQLPRGSSCHDGAIALLEIAHGKVSRMKPCYISHRRSWRPPLYLQQLYMRAAGPSARTRLRRSDRGVSAHITLRARYLFDEWRAANDGQQPFCALAGRCQGTLSNQPAAACARPVCLAVCGLLRRHGEHSTATELLPSGRVDLAQMAGTSNAGNAVHLGQLPSAPHPSAAAKIIRRYTGWDGSLA